MTDTTAADIEKTGRAILALVGFVLGIARSFFDAFVVLMLWTWFIVPLGVGQIGYWHAYGLDLIIGLFALSAFNVGTARQIGKAVKESPAAALGDVLVKCIAYSMALFLGFLAHTFMTGAA